MQITVFGPTGQVGGAVLREALATGYRVRVLARSPGKLGGLRGEVEIVEGDLLDGAAVAGALRGSAAVINAAGGVKEPDQYGKFQRIGRILLDAMKREGIPRLVNISGAVTPLPAETLDPQRRLMRMLVGLLYREMKQGQEAMMPLIANERDVSWTVVRPAVISRKPGTGRVLAREGKLPGTTIMLDDLARFMVEQVDSGDWVRNAPLVASAPASG